MLFNSIIFFFFLPLVFFIYWSLARFNISKIQSLVLLFASYVFYGWWDYRFLALIFLSTLVDFFVGKKIHKSTELYRKAWVWLSIIFNLGLLGFFKYFNFFIDSWVTLFNSIGYDMGESWTLKIILPVGISFYTFQTMSYSIDIYRKQLKPTSDFIGFAAFVSFFPQLVAGPIERASNLLPQILSIRQFNYKNAVKGLRLMLWGMFKKVAIADSIATSVNDIFANHESYSWTILVLGAFLFTIQIYCDFSGYSDIAIGTAKLFNINLMTNFRFPYFSRNIGEFWRRWHISLSSWFRDYVYIPLGGSRVRKSRAFRNILIVFLLSGLWHGANWTFLAWGLIHALLFLPSFLMGVNTKEFTNWSTTKRIDLNTLGNVIRVIGLFLIMILTWVFFRAESIEHALKYLGGIFSLQSGNAIFLNPYDYQSLNVEFLLVGVLFTIEFILLHKLFTIKIKFLRWSIYALTIFAIVTSVHLNSNSPFIYFQF